MGRVRFSKQQRMVHDLGNSGKKVVIPNAQITYRDLLEALSVHAGLRAAISFYARGVASPSMKLVRDDRFQATDAQKRAIEEFLFIGGDRDFNNLLDLFGFTQKMFLTAGYFRATGQAAWWVLRNKDDLPVGWDFLLGLVVPLVDKSSGTFKRPAYKVYTPRKMFSPMKVDRPDDLVLFLHPDLAGKLWGTDVESLLELTIPSDINAQEAYLSIHRDRTAPHDGVWQLPPDTSDEEFRRVEKMLKYRYGGAHRYGASPLLARGNLEFKPLNRRPDEAPYLEGRNVALREISAASGVFSALIGDTERISMSNMRELRRTYWETTQRPLAKMIEDVIWLQVCIRFFNAPGWRPKIDSPDFLTGVEKAAIAARNRQWGIFDRNEARKLQGYPPIEGGDGDFLLPLNVQQVGERGGAPDPTSPSSGDMLPGEEDPTSDVSPPYVRPEDTQRLEEAELARWRGLAISNARKGRDFRSWVPRNIHPALAAAINDELRECWPSESDIKRVFDAAQEVWSANHR